MEKESKIHEKKECIAKKMKALKDKIKSKKVDFEGQKPYKEEKE